MSTAVVDETIPSRTYPSFRFAFFPALLRTAVERAEADPDVHAVIVTGAGKAFCAGADLSALGAAGLGAAESGLQRIYDGFMAVGNCRLPTIAAVNGAAVGAGLNLAM